MKQVKIRQKRFLRQRRASAIIRHKVPKIVQTAQGGRRVCLSLAAHTAKYLKISKPVRKGGNNRSG